MKIIKVVFVSIVYILTAPIWLPFIIIIESIGFFKKINFIRKNQGKKFFVYSNKHNWGTFIQNNVLSELNEDFIIVCYEKRNIKNTAEILVNNKTKMPLFCFVKNNKIIRVSIYENYVNQRHQNKINETVRTEIRAKISNLA